MGEELKNYKLYYNTICGYSRAVRIMLTEYKINFTIVENEFWKANRNLIQINPALSLPILIDESENKIIEFYPILEYLIDMNIADNLLGDTILQKAETRRIINWFSIKFYNEVIKYIINEKIIKFAINKPEPNSNLIRAAKHNLRNHLNYISFLLEKNRWLAGECFTAADIICASMLSILDYLDDINWNQYPLIKEWYSLVKSRPSFQALLKEEIKGYKASAQYAQLDF